MLNPARLAEALEELRPRLRAAFLARRDEVSSARVALTRLSSLSLGQMRDTLGEVASPGALPTEEHNHHPRQVVAFAHIFAGHRPAREWAAETLSRQTTFAVDGSQLSLSDDLDPPVAAAQVGWFVNAHLPSERHEKDVRLEVLTEGSDGESDDPTDRVDVRRFEMEVEHAHQLMVDLATREPAPICFLDDPLVVPFAAERGPGRADAYITGISRLMEASERLHVPLIGYTADPSARDLAWMLHSLDLLPDPPHTPDASILAPLLASWGDRSCFYVCARRSPHLQEYRRADGSSLADQIVFCYLRVTGHGRPARLEVPRWLLQDGAERERVLDVVRAECVAGLGYPYVLEAAHDAAVITGRDRARFARAFSGLCADMSIPLTTTTKGASKRRRGA